MRASHSQGRRAGGAGQLGARPAAGGTRLFHRPSLTPPTPPKARELADKALASFVIIQAALRRSRRLAEIAARPDVQARLPGFEVKMGFGLHLGWAIEGAIGSEYKARDAVGMHQGWVPAGGCG